MKRNMDLFRAIALYVENSNNQPVDSELISLPDADVYTIAYHVDLMFDAGLLKGQDVTTMSDHCKTFRIDRLTNAGHDFLDNARSETVWARTKQKLAEVGGSASLALLSAVLKKTVAESLGIVID